MERVRTRGLVLRRTPYRDNDLIVDLLTEDVGRLSALARGGRSSRKRFGGALEIGTRLKLDATRKGTGMATLGDVQVELALNTVRGDLDAINHLCFALEIARLTGREGAPDPALFRLVADFVDRLEVTLANDEALVLWELSVLAHLGYRLRLDRCVVSGGRPDALSMMAGGAISLAAARPPDASPVAFGTLAVLARLAQGEVSAVLPVEGKAELRLALTAIWQGMTGKTLRTAAFLG